MKLSAVILTKNEDKNIERCLKSLDFVDEVIIVDDYSDDKTLEIIQKIDVGVGHDRPVFKVIQRKLNGDFAGQRNFGISKANSDWVLFIDADEEVTKELRNEILEHLQVDKEAFYLKRRDFFWGKELKYGELKQIRQLGFIRLIRKNSGQWLGNVHEVFHTAKKTGQLNGFINHYPHPNLKEFIKDINYYSSLRAEELNRLNIKVNILEIIFVPALKFIFNYLINFGFLDGVQGFTYAFMMSFHSFLVRSKLYQLQNL
ncbi:glycosyltransferase family 2 protein [Candidatus Roizmanbacteria bacterium]|nr:glycosyltransferase family 2 protein [Candidatus Roizmanbacteria bacterium]